MKEQIAVQSSTAAVAEIFLYQIPADVNVNQIGKEKTVHCQFAKMEEFHIMTHVLIVRLAFAVDFAIKRMQTVNYRIPSNNYRILSNNYRIPTNNYRIPTNDSPPSIVR